ncbi:MinD/ParA family ATP-binding protein [Nautilia sp.]
MVIPIVSLKGGVGKSTISINLSDTLAFEEKTILIDTDQQNSIASLFCKRFKKGFSEVMFDMADLDEVIMKVFEDENLYIIPTGMYAIENPIRYEDEFDIKKLKKIILKLTNKFKYLIFDTSPRISKPVMSLLEVSDYFLIVITPDPASVASLKIFLDTLEERKIAHKYSLIVNNMHPDQITEDFYSFIQAVSKNNIVGTLPTDITVLESSAECTTVRRYDKDSAFAYNMNELAKNLKRMIKKIEDEYGDFS